jgi:acyl carrier protein
MMEKAELQDKVCSILADQLAVDPDKVTPDARFSEDLDADSLDLVEAVLALEEEFGVSIPEEEMEGVKTVAQAIDLVAGKVGAGT